MEKNLNGLPNALNCGFAIISAIAIIIQKYPYKCADLLKLFKSNGVDRNSICVSNWACKNAETMRFHQECDSSYTLISTPIWDHDDLIINEKTIGKANFIFKWTNCKHGWS